VCVSVLFLCFPQLKPLEVSNNHHPNTEWHEASVDWTKGVHVLYLQLNYRIRKTLEIQDILD